MRQQPWKITVGRKAEIIAEFEIPTHRMEGKKLEAFLIALVTCHVFDRPEDMARVYLNRRKGGGERSNIAEIDYFINPEDRKAGKFCGTWECYAMATHNLSSDKAKFLIREREKRRFVNLKERG